MSISTISSQPRQDLFSLANALNSGNVSAAQTAFDNFSAGSRQLSNRDWEQRSAIQAEQRPSAGSERSEFKQSFKREDGFRQFSAGSAGKRDSPPSFS
jgi:hypothetical protein